MSAELSLGLDEAVRELPTGSMWPVIRPGESIRFRRAPSLPRIGEVWVAQRGPLHGVHRVLWVRSDGWLPRSLLRPGERGGPERKTGAAPTAAAPRTYLGTRRVLGAALSDASLDWASCSPAW